MKWYKVQICARRSVLHYYTELQVEPGDTLIVETKGGTTLTGTVNKIISDTDQDPFKPNSNGYRATCHVLENVTKKQISNVEENKIMMMIGNKTVEVKHCASSRRGIFYTDLDLKEGELVVYERVDDHDRLTMHVGVVTNADPDAVCASSFVVSKLDTTAYEERKRRAQEAEKLHAKLEAKKKQFQDVELLRLIAASDPETKDLLDKYMSLINPVQREV